MKLVKGIFTISIDFEFAWGYVDQKLSAAHRQQIKKEIEITESLIALLEKYEMPASWAVVTHLLEKDCGWQDGTAHSDFPRPVIRGEERDWFWQHPKKNDDSELWFDKFGLIEKIKSCRVKQEIASHSYAHIIYGDPDINSAAVEFDLKKAKQIHEQNGLPFKSFVFPRNQVGYQELLKKYGIICYRQSHSAWYEGRGRTIKRIAHIIDYYYPGTFTGLPKVDESGLVALPDSMLLIGRNGVRKIILPAAVIKKAKRGIEKACQKKEVFHLWFHPTNFVQQTAAQFNILEKIFSLARALQVEKKIEILTMSEIAERFLNLAE
jgi:peptidoglycan/xylan/chitin deacetylase (PgdA/CDA1 family)